MALPVLPMFAFEAWRGETVDPVAPGIFTVIALLATGLIALGGVARPRLVARTVHGS